MSITPGKPRLSAIPTPGRSSSIPTPGRSRPPSSASQYTPVHSDVDYMSRAFADAIKANDPAQHRNSRASDISSAQSSPPPPYLSSQSGRHSVTARSASVASTSSAAGHTPYKAERPKTPTAIRPPSRQSDVFGRSSSRVGHKFDVGDNVRIESLGFEGILKYIGEIDGKSGLWAGVELSEGFAGKGKNNGSVNGKQYFVCPPNRGVFVATTKLSAPIVRAGGIHRPSSVASSRGGRTTPSFSGMYASSTSSSIQSGRVTPSVSSGRVTPSFRGRVTPNVTPAQPRMRALSKSTVKTPTVSSQGKANGRDLKLTEGSIASKYQNLTAKQLNSRHSAVSTPSQGSSSPSRSIPSPTRVSLGFGSPTRPLSSPFNTPKPAGRVSNIGVGMPSTTPSKGRPSLITPRANRIPSAIAMPPPASPVGPSSSRSVSLNDCPLRPPGSESKRSTNGDHSLSDLEVSGKALQDKIAFLMSGKTTPSSAKVSSRPSSVTSVRSLSHTVELQAHIDRLQSRVDSLEYENQRLRESENNSKSDELHISSNHIQTLQEQREESLTRISELETQVKTTERTLDERKSKIESLERNVQQVMADLDRQRNESESRLKDMQAKLEDGDAMVKNLKEALEVKEGLENQNDTMLKAKNAEIALLESRLQKISADWEQDRKELGAQVDELRLAGQETIALYEERLSAADSNRYELEDRIAFLEDQARKGTNSMSPRQGSSAAEIDNETLRDQVQHLQKKVQSLEDMLEDAQIASEKEEAAVRERMRRFREKEEAMKKELSEGRKEVEQMLKSEATARGRVEENEEALRESTMALENARAEIEILRTEVANLDSLAASGSSGDTSQRLADSVSRVASERSRFSQEIAELRQSLEESRACQHELANERLELRHALDERSTELDTLRKRINREIPINTGLQEPYRNSRSSSPQSPSSKYELSMARDEITGLKHIVQELQKDNQVAAQRNKLLESENRLLVSETDQLRQELQLLEDNVEQSLLRQEEALDLVDKGTSSPGSGDSVALNKALKEQKVKFEMDLEQLRKRLTETEMKLARAKHDYTKEISELEALVESKIYREDELEQELERMKEKLTRSQNKSAKNGDADDIRPRISLTSDIDRGSLDSSKQDVICEICEQRGHDTFNCNLLMDDTQPPARLSKSFVGDNSLDLFCEDCESHGHRTADCPHSMDVF